MKKTSLTWTIAILLGAAAVMLFLRGQSGNIIAPTKQPQNIKPLPFEVAEGGVQIYGTAWGMTLSEDGSGFYNELIRLFLDGLETPVQYDILPYRRAKALFYRNTESCLYPSNIDLLMDGGEISSADGLIDTRGILNVKVYVFSPPGTAPPASAHDVDHRSVAYAMGSRVPFFLRGANADFIAVANESDKARMLLSGRVDLMTAAMPDAKFVFEAMQKPLPPFNPEYELNNTLARVTCHDTPKNRAFVAAFNTHAMAVLKGGKAHALMLENRLDAASYLPPPKP